MRIKKVEYFNDYKLKILFSDEKIKIVNIEPIIKTSKRLFQPLKDLDYFKKVSLDDPQYPFSICWPNGEDLCPDVLYDMGVDLVASQGSHFLKNKHNRRPRSLKKTSSQRS